MDEKMKEVARHLGECVAMCNYCFNACLGEHDVKMMVKCIKLDKECAEICSLASASLASQGVYAKEILRLCVEACRNCAEECEKYSHQHCLDCAKVCRECAEVCSTFL